MKDRKNMVMIIIIGITISLFLCFNSTVFATTGIVTTNDLRVRKEESTSSDILTLLDENDKVEILSESDEWYKVKANNKIGYVSKQYINVKNNDIAKSENNEENKKSETENNQQQEINNESQSSNEANNNNIESQPKYATITSEEQIRIVPLINGDVVETIKPGEKYEIISSVSLWSYIKGNGKSGWILNQKIIIEETTINNENNNTQSEDQTEQNISNETQQENVDNTENIVKEEKSEKMYSESKTYYVKGSSVNVRSSANKESNVVKVLDVNEQVTVIGEDDEWYIVSVNGQKSYIKKNLLSSKKIETTSRSSSKVIETAKAEEKTTTTKSNPKGEEIVAYAKTFLGYPYVYGTNGPKSFDCSGFVQYVYKHFGYSLSRSSKTQINDGVGVSKNNLQPGDVLIFKNTSKTEIGHVGIYIGGGQFIHASNSRTGVIISSLSTSAYQQRYVTARRIL